MQGKPPETLQPNNGIQYCITGSKEADACCWIIIYNNIFNIITLIDCRRRHVAILDLWTTNTGPSSPAQP